MRAITREVSPAMARCELSYIARQPIDLEKASQQHRAYVRLLEEFGLAVISLPAEPELPDSMFVEDPAIVLDESAVIFPLGTESRRPEATSLEAAITPFRKCEHVILPGMVEGGDVLQVGRQIFVGRTKRSNDEGIRQLAQLLSAYKYEVIAVPVTGCLHLKSAVTHLGRNTLLANRAWFDPAAMPGFDWIDIAPQEPHAANALAVREKIIFPESFPKTRALLEANAFNVVSLDISELQKAESGLTCSSLIFR